MLERNISEISNELLIYIFTFLRQTDLIHAARVNRLFNSIAISAKARTNSAANNHSADQLLLSYIGKNVYRRAAVSLLPNNQIAIGNHDGTISIWNYDKEKVVSSFCALANAAITKNTEILCVVYIGENKIISTVFDKSVRIYNLETTECLASIPLGSSARCAAMLDDGEVALGCYDGTIRILDYNKRKVTRSFAAGSHWIQQLCKLPNGEIASTSQDGLVRINNYFSGSVIKLLNKEYCHMNWSIDVIYLGHNMIATSHEDGLRIWNYRTGECLRMLLGESSKYYKHHSHKCTALVPIGKNKIACSRGNFIEVWNFETGKLLQIISDHRQIITYILHPSKLNHRPWIDDLETSNSMTRKM